MLESKGILLFDYDGTLVDGSIGIHEISKKTVEALQTARQNGYLTILASGRSISMVEPVQYLFDGFITTNGAYACIRGTEYENRIIEVDTLRRFNEFLKGKDDVIYADYEMQDFSYCSRVGSAIYERIMEYFGLDRSKFGQWEDQYENGYNKMTVMYENPEVYAELESIFGEELEMINHPTEDYAEIMPKGCTKGSALEAILEKSGYPREKVYAFGDSENDYTMLKAAGHATIMGKHSKIVEEAADFVTLKVEEEGIVYALKHWGIIK